MNQNPTEIISRKITFLNHFKIYFTWVFLRRVGDLKLRVSLLVNPCKVDGRDWPTPKNGLAGLLGTLDTGLELELESGQEKPLNLFQKLLKLILEDTRNGIDTYRPASVAATGQWRAGCWPARHTSVSGQKRRRKKMKGALWATRRWTPSAARPNSTASDRLAPKQRRPARGCTPCPVRWARRWRACRSGAGRATTCAPSSPVPRFSSWYFK